MRRLVFLAVMAALVFAKPKPETYRETEDFQYSRSSSDDGTKSGFYGAQRGNMGGNYERAHNMDLLAQNQMSGLVRQVDGELGQGANTRTGSVYTAANSRGIYGSGNYDLSNLKGRNFAEGESLGHSQASQAYSSLTSHNSGYRGHSYGGSNSIGFSSNSQAQNSRYSGYQSLGHADQSNIDNLQAAGTSQSLGRYENNNQAGYDAQYRTQYGSHGQSEFDQSSTNIHRSSGLGANTQSRYITTPVKVVLRPGGRVAIPIAAPTYDISQSVVSEDKDALNSDAEIFNQHANFQPTNKVKHYESSYSYRKQWEKHHTQPADTSIGVPTDNPFPKNSELNDDVQLLQSAKEQFHDSNLQTAHSRNINSEHRTNAQSAASTSSTSQSAFNSQHNQFHSGFNTQQNSASSGTYANNGYRHNAQKTGMTADLTNTAENIDLKPKSYQSSYSYHKSWERKGDPYVIIPTNYDNQVSQKLTAASANNAAYSSHHYGSHSRQGQQRYIDCDDEEHVRVARSYNADKELGQQQQSKYFLSQPTQSGLEKLEDLGQQTQSKWENLEDLDQQQQTKWDDLQDLGQQTQTQWDNLQVGQERQNQWDNNNFQQINQENLQNLGQQTETKWDKLEDLAQHTQSNLEQTENGYIEDLNQHSQKDENFEQQANGPDVAEYQRSDTKQEGQLDSNNWNQITEFEHQSNVQNLDTNNKWNTHKINELDQSQQNPWYQSDNTNYDDFMRPISVSKDNAPIFPQSVNEKPNLFPLPLSNTEHKSVLDQSNIEYDLWKSHHYQHSDDNSGNNFWHMNDFSNNKYEHNVHSHSFTSSNSGSTLQNLWNKIDNIGGEFTTNKDKNLFSYDSSNFYSHNQNFNFMQNGYSWGDKIYPQFQTPHQNAGNVEGISSEHHNLFNEQREDISTTTKSNIIVIPSTSPRPTDIIGTSITSHDVKPTHVDKNISSPDEGRGDIGPEDTFIEIMATRKPYKTPEEIDSLSLTKEKPLSRPDQIIIRRPSVLESKDNNTGNTYTVISMDTQDTMKENKQNTQSETSQSRIPSTPITTTLKSNIVNHKPTLDVTASNYHSTYLQNHRRQENVEIPEVVQQENLEQQFEGFDQQSQNPWFSNVDLQQEYDQQNMEQQFEVFQQQVTNKPYKTPEEIETLSLTKETNIPPADSTVQQNVRDKKEEDTVSKLFINNLSNQNKQFKLSNTPQSQTPTTTEVSTATSNIPKSINAELPNMVESNNKPMTNQREDTQNSKNEKTTESIETPENIQQQNLEQQFEDFGQQLQGSWFPSDNLQQGYDQQNTDQQFEVFHQQDLQSPTDLQDFGQQAQSPSQIFEDSPVNQQQHPKKQIKLYNFDQNTPPSLNSKETIVPQHVEPQQSNLQHIISAVEEQTEKPGFWKSVGSKLSNAKHKVFSWFKQS